MGARNKLYGAVVLGAGINVNAERNHTREHGGGRLHMGDSVLGGPGTEARGVRFVGHGNGQVLVPGDVPVGGRGLVEKNGADRARSVSESGVCYWERGGAGGKGAHRRAATEQIAETSGGGGGGRGTEGFDGGGERIELSDGDRGRHQGVAVGFEGGGDESSLVLHGVVSQQCWLVYCAALAHRSWLQVRFIRESSSSIGVGVCPCGIAHGAIYLVSEP